MSSDPNDRPHSSEAPAEPTKASDTPQRITEEAVSPQTGLAQDPGSQTAPTAESASPEQSPPATQTESHRREQPSAAATDAGHEATRESRPGRQILIGSQRDVAAYRPRPKRDSIPVVGLKRRPRRASVKHDPKAKAEGKGSDQTTGASSHPPTEAEHSGDRIEPPATQPGARSPGGIGTTTGKSPEEAVAMPDLTPATAQAGEQMLPKSAPATPAEQTPALGAGLPTSPQPVRTSETLAQREETQSRDETQPKDERQPPEADAPQPGPPFPSEADAPQTQPAEPLASATPQPETEPAEPFPSKRFPPPNVRDRLPPELEEEFQEALADAELDELIAGGEAITKQGRLEPHSKHNGRVVTVRRADVFVELGSREQGVLPLEQFPEPPQIGAEVEVRVRRFSPEEGLYELVRAGAAADVADWSELDEGMVVEAKVTGHNSGGLECEVNRLRGFIPISQIALYRVEDPSEFVDQKLTCLVTECNPQRRNLVLSRRALLEREQEEARRNLLESLQPGQIREGVVRKLVDFGAFVDLGGLDGLVHVSQLAWGRVDHPREVLHEGQTIQVRVREVDKANRRISLAYRDLQENPWNDVEMKYPVNTAVRGKVTKLMEFGAFVELEPGVEGLVHISELAHRRVWRVSDVVHEGEEVDLMVLSVDAKARRIGLSMKGLIPEPAPAKADGKDAPSETEAPPPPPRPPKKRNKPLAGGLGRSPGGEKFGLKW